MTNKLFEDWDAPTLERITGGVSDGVLTLMVTIRWEDCLFAVEGTPAMFDANKSFPIYSDGGAFTWAPAAKEVLNDED